MSKRELFQTMYNDTTMSLWFTIRYLLFDWPDEPIKVFFKIFSLLLTPVLLLLTLVQTIMTILGLLFNCVPVLRDVMAFIFLVLIGNIVIMPLTFALTAYNRNDYQSKLRYYNLMR